MLNSFVHEDKSIMNVTIYGPDSETHYFLAATGNHPFWVAGTGWTRADQLKPGFVLRRSYETCAKVAGLRHVYRTESEGIGWIAQLCDVVGSYRSLFDYANYASAPKGPGEAYLSDDVYKSADPYLKVRVYNLEVEDFHTYYVGAKGFWVHDANCARVELADSKGFSQMEFHRFMRRSAVPSSRSSTKAPKLVHVLVEPAVGQNPTFPSTLEIRVLPNSLASPC